MKYNSYSPEGLKLKRPNIPNIGKGMEQLELSYSPYGNVERFNNCEKQIGSFFIVTHLPKESEFHSNLHKRNKISTAHLFIGAKNLKQAKCPA